MVNPGYLKAVWMNEIGGRYMSTLEEHKGGFLYYYDMLLKFHFADWFWLIIPAIVISFCIRDEKMKKLCVYSSLLMLSYWLIISSTQTKLQWYEVPMFPFLAIITGSVIYIVFVFLKDATQINSLLKYNLLPYLFLVLVFYKPYTKMLDRVYQPMEYSWDETDYSVGYLLQKAVKNKVSIKDYKICFDGYSTQLLFYVNLLNERQQNVKLDKWGDLKAGDLAIACQPGVQSQIEGRYDVTADTAGAYVKKYRINRIRASQ